MNLKNEFLAAWKAGQDHDALLGIVHRHQGKGVSSQEAYEVLHQLWLESDFNDVETTGTLQDDLEYVLEKIWYECPAS